VNKDLKWQLRILARNRTCRFYCQ